VEATAAEAIGTVDRNKKKVTGKTAIHIIYTPAPVSLGDFRQ